MVERSRSGVNALTVVLAVAATLVATVLAAGPAFAKGPGSGGGRPGVTVSVSDDGTATYTVNRPERQIGDRTCTLDGAPVSCGSLTASEKRSVTYQVTLSADPGTHTFAVVVMLDHGGELTGSDDFTVVEPAQLCADLGGTFAWHVSRWYCSWTGLSSEPTELFATMDVHCAARSGTSVGHTETGWTATYVCLWQTTVAAQDACFAGPGTGFGLSDSWLCIYAPPAPDLVATLTALCAEAGGTWTDLASDSVRTFTCHDPV